jgi:hypothetical protein
MSKLIVCGVKMSITLKCAQHAKSCLLVLISQPQPIMSIHSVYLAHLGAPEGRGGRMEGVSSRKSGKGDRGKGATR